MPAQADVTAILEPLNEAQRQAVTSTAPGLLVLAGAGSGKTRTLTHRSAWLLRGCGIPPHAILAVTFTNKAAREMRQRIEDLLGGRAAGLLTGTFHGIANRLLKIHWQKAGLAQNFRILDSDDQLRMIKRVCRDLNIDDKKWAPKGMQSFINAQKEDGLRPGDVEVQDSPHARIMLQVYTEYETCRVRAEAADFADLLLYCYELWRDCPEVLAHYQERFQHILVDEFQDTNAIQYDWLRQLGGGGACVMAVGDDDQSIYGWRGARIANIHGFATDFSGTETVRLEQNYRSSKNILQAANAVIAHNEERLGKQLRTEKAPGPLLELHAAQDEEDEAAFVAERITDWRAAGAALSGAAVLYRTHAQSRVLEQAMKRSGLAYRIYGGTRFYERMEIRDAVAYLRLVANRSDDAAFMRAVNTPSRGIGARTMERLRLAARENGIVLWQAAQRLAAGGEGERTTKAMGAFLDLIETLAAEADRLSLPEMAELALERSRLREHYAREGEAAAAIRLENLEELVNACRQFVPSEDAEGNASILQAFLNEAALDMGEGSGGEQGVQMMTMHSAKGLEFPLVCIVGLEDGLFPSSRAFNATEELEEERRLCYVALTRAQQQLYLSRAGRRYLHGERRLCQPSRFLEEIPEELLHKTGDMHAEQLTQMRASSSSGRAAGGSGGGAIDGEFSLGQRVRHGKFGEGTILNIEGQGDHARVRVDFAAAGSKWLVLSYAGLQPVGMRSS